MDLYHLYVLINFFWIYPQPLYIALSQVSARVVKYPLACKSSAGVLIIHADGPAKNFETFRKNLTVPKTVAQCRKNPNPYLNTLNRTEPYFITLSRTIPYLNSPNRTIPYLNTLPSAANQLRVLRHPSRQPIRIDYYVTREFSAKVGIPSRFPARVGSL